MEPQYTPEQTAELFELEKQRILAKIETEIMMRAAQLAQFNPSNAAVKDERAPSEAFLNDIDKIEESNSGANFTHDGTFHPYIPVQSCALQSLIVPAETLTSSNATNSLTQLRLNTVFSNLNPYYRDAARPIICEEGKVAPNAASFQMYHPTTPKLSVSNQVPPPTILRATINNQQLLHKTPRPPKNNQRSLATETLRTPFHEVIDLTTSSPPAVELGNAPTPNAQSLPKSGFVPSGTRNSSDLNDSDLPSPFLKDRGQQPPVASNLGNQKFSPVLSTPRESLDTQGDYDLAAPKLSRGGENKENEAPKKLESESKVDAVPWSHLALRRLRNTGSLIHQTPIHNPSSLIAPNPPPRELKASKTARAIKTPRAPKVSKPAPQALQKQTLDLLVQPNTEKLKSPQKRKHTLSPDTSLKGDKLVLTKRRRPEMPFAKARADEAIPATLTKIRQDNSAEKPTKKRKNLLEQWNEKLKDRQENAASDPEASSVNPMPPIKQTAVTPAMQKAIPKKWEEFKREEATRLKAFRWMRNTEDTGAGTTAAAYKNPKPDNTKGKENVGPAPEPPGGMIRSASTGASNRPVTATRVKGNPIVIRENFAKKVKDLIILTGEEE
ncbi:MAG: hypothetical protein MMC33_008599 [Icmadophila ericetorum]|nr:hypothetical protein [Icmadophila ericetorum]